MSNLVVAHELVAIGVGMVIINTMLVIAVFYDARVSIERTKETQAMVDEVGWWVGWCVGALVGWCVGG